MRKKITLAYLFKKVADGIAFYGKKSNDPTYNNTEAGKNAIMGV